MSVSTEQASQLFGPRLIDHGLIRGVLDMSLRFAEDESPTKGLYLAEEFDSFSVIASSVEGCSGVFGTGYPFYAFRQDGGVYDVKEISRFTGQVIDLTHADEKRSVGGWLCGVCQVVVDHPDLKVNCKPCELVALKPRDVFKALPDLDFWAIADDNCDIEKFLLELQYEVRQHGFKSSDGDIHDSVQDVADVLSDLENGRYPTRHLPIDLHVVTKSDLLDAISRVPDAVRTGKRLDIIPYSLRISWSKPSQGYDFAKDFVFSLTPGDKLDPEVADALASSRGEIKGLLECGSLAVEYVMNRAPKERRQLATEGLRAALRERVASW